MPKSDPVLLHVKAGMTVSFQVADADTGVINWVNADLVPHLVPRV